MVRNLTPRRPHNVAKSLGTNYEPLFVRVNDGLQFCKIHRSRKISAICVDVVDEVEIDRVSFEQRSVFTTTCWFPLVAFGNGPRSSMDTMARVYDGGNS